MSKHYPPKYLTLDEMAGLTTPRLLAYKNRMMKVREQGDRDGFDEPDYLGGKQCPVWQDNYRLCKEVLAKREHVTR